MPKLDRHALECDDKLTIRGLVLWCQEYVADAAFLNDELSFEEHCERVQMELCVTADRWGAEDSRAAMEGPGQVADVEEEALNVAQSLAGLSEENWPRVHDEPTPVGAPGRFAKAFPLCLPMGIADMFDWRTTDVSPSEWVQHMLRLSTGLFVSGVRGHRELWALVNTVLLNEARGKGAAVRKNFMRRVGGRVVGYEYMTKGRLREMIQDEQQVRTLVHQLMTVGRDVRSTPMCYAYEHKKLDCAVRQLSWRPPWVRSRSGVADHRELLLQRLLHFNESRADKPAKL